MQRLLTPIIRLAAGFALALALTTVRAEDKEKKADPNGTWTWSMTTQSGETRTSTMKLKLDGEKLTGTVTGRNNNENAIEEGKLAGDEISFKVTREFNGNKMIAKYSGKISGDTIKGRTEFTRPNGESGSRDWEAKRQAAAK